MRFRQPREKDERHLEFVRSLCCVSCDDPTSVEAAHLRAGNLKYGKRHTGMQEKPSDRWTLPLCSRCHHQDQHAGSETEFWERIGIDPWILAMTLFGCSGDYVAATNAIALQRGK